MKLISKSTGIQREQMNVGNKIYTNKLKKNSTIFYKTSTQRAQFCITEKEGTVFQHIHKSTRNRMQRYLLASGERGRMNKLLSMLSKLDPILPTNWEGETGDKEQGRAGNYRRLEAADILRKKERGICRKCPKLEKETNWTPERCIILVFPRWNDTPTRYSVLRKNDLWNTNYFFYRRRSNISSEN